MQAILPNKTKKRKKINKKKKKISMKKKKIRKKKKKKRRDGGDTLPIRAHTYI